ncbi:MAG: DNA-binding response regulator [Bacteroidota bacterium]
MIAVDLKYIRVLLVEDNVKSTEMFLDLLKEINITRVEIARSYVEAVRLFEKHLFDILLIDIVLGKNRKGGDDFARFVRKKQIDIPFIYLTSYYTEQVYDKVKDTHPSNLLSKDCSTLQLRQSIELSLNTSKISQPKSEHELRIKSDNFFVKIGNVYKAIAIKDISYFFAKNKSTYVQHEDRSYPISVLLKDLEEQLYTHSFARVHKTYLVNLNKIELIDLQNNQITIQDNQLPIGYVYRKRVLSRLNLLR